MRHRERVQGDLYDVTVFLLKENIDIYAAMAILMQKDHFRSCISLARSLLENAVTLRWVYEKDSEKRAKNLKDMSRYSYLERTRKLKSVPPEYKELLKTYEKLLEGYDPKSRVSMKAMFDELGYGKAYEEWYGRLSEYTHSRYRSNTDFNEVWPFTTFMRRLVFTDVLVLIFEFLKAATECFDLEGGVILIEDYPHDNADLFYKFYPRKSEKLMA